MTDELLTILFTDVEGPTALYSARGDAEARGFLAAIDEIARGQVRAHAGRPVRSLGDGLMALFSSPRAAVACALAVQAAVADHGTRNADQCVRVRAGLHTGAVSALGGDVSGEAVHAAARICARAGGGEVLGSEVIRQLCGSVAGIAFESRGRVALKGFPERWHLYRILPVVTPAAVGAAPGEPISSPQAEVLRGRRGPGGRANAPGLRVRLLGRFELEGIDTGAVRSRKARTVLRVLALARGAPVPVHRLVDIAWGEAPPSEPEQQLAVLVSRLRGAVGADLLRRFDAGYALAVAWSDLDTAASFIDEGERRLAGGAALAAQAAATAAVGLHRGPLLADEPDVEWAQTERLAADRQLLRARHLLASAALAAGDVATAVTAAEAALDADAFDEEALRLLITAHAAAGRKASALAVFERFREQLADELGVDPAPSTVAAHLAVLQDRPVPGVVVGQRAGPVAVGDLSAAPGPEGRLVGRDVPLSALDLALARVASAPLEVLVVEGEAGIGKSRLVEEWTRAVADRGTVVLRGRCDELGRALPMQPVLDALAEHLGGLEGAAAAVLLGAEAALLGDLLGTGGSLLPTGAVVPAANDIAAQSVVAEAVRRVLVRVAERPAVLVIEDVHLADPSTVDLLSRLRHRPSSARLLVVATRRTGEGPALDASARLPLEPLDLEACAVLVGESAAPVLHRRSGGNPLLLLELSRASDADEIPASLRDAVAAQCERLGPAASTLRAAAVLGPELDLEVLAAILGLSPVTLLDHLEDAARRQVLVERGGGFAFRHELVREALVAGAGTARRALLHREAARLLSLRPRADPLAVAYHARHGGDLARAATSLVEASRIAAMRGDHAEALRFLDDAGSLDDTASVHIERARVLLLGNRREEAAIEGRRAVEQGGGAAALEVAAAVRYYQRDLAESVRLADEAAAQAPDGTVRAGALLIGARSLHALGDLPAAEARLGQAAAAAEVGAAVRGLWLGFLRIHQGDPAEGLRLVEVASAAPEASINLFAPVHAHYTAGYALASLGRVEEAMRRFDELDATCERLHVTRFAGRSDNFRGWMLRNLGEHAAADERTAQAIDAGRRIDYAEVQAQGWLDLCDGALQRGDLDAAAGHLAAAEPFGDVEHAFRWRHRLRMRLLDARLRLATGDAATAAAALEALEADSMALGVRRYIVQARLLLLRARLAAGEAVDPAAVSDEVTSLEEVAGLDGWRLAAEVAGASGRPEWAAAARRLAARLAANAGPLRSGFEAYAARTLETTTIRAE